MTARRAFGLLLLAVAGAAVLHAARSSLPAPPLDEPGRLGDWWIAQGTEIAALCIVRMVGLALCCYLVLIGFLGTVAALTRWRWTFTLTTWVATPALRRMVAGGGLAVALSSTSAAAGAGPADYSLADIGAAPVEDYSLADIGAAPVEDYSLADIGPAADTDGESADRAPGIAADGVYSVNVHPISGRVAAEGGSPSPIVTLGSADAGLRAGADPGVAAGRGLGADGDGRTEAAETWLVEPGDHLWGIAAGTVAERTGSDDHMSVLRYWLRLIEANADTVGDDPDLIHPGQLIRLPR